MSSAALAPFLAVLSDALLVAGDLRSLHSSGRLHGALTPESLRREGDTGRVSGIAAPDSGSGAALFSLRRVSLLQLRLLRYASPEQAGRLAHKLSARSDLYALGVLMYEWIKGEPPFVASDPLELVHQQLTAMPAPLEARVPGVPQSLADIVRKLLHKAPVERYGSAAALIPDLEECRRRLLEGDTSSFPLGTHDTAGELRIPSKLYGRARDITRLTGLYTRAANGETILCQVGGYSGIGKTSLIRSLRTVHLPRGHGIPEPAAGVMLEGKYDQCMRQIPYSAIAAMLSSLVRRILSESSASVDSWRRRLVDDLGEDAAVVTGAVPDLIRLIGPQPEPDALGAAAARHRFNHAFGKLFTCLCMPERPLVVFLDDMQWADLASIDLIQSLLVDQCVPRFLFICAYRDNEVDAAHPFMHTLAAVRRKGICVEEMTVGPLQLADLEQLVEDACSNLLERTEFCRKVLDKTGGNPFYVRQFLSELHASGLLLFDARSGRWTTDAGAADTLGRSENVIELMTRKMRRMPADALRALHTAACIGSRFSLTLLALALDVEQDDALAMLAPALHEMVTASGESAAREFTFVHDRVQQAARSLESESHELELQLRLARKMLATLPPAQEEEHLFMLADHFRTASKLLTDRAERLSVAQLFLRAGGKAKAAMAYTASADYLRAGIALLPADAWEAHFTLTYDLHLSAAEALDLCGSADFDAVCAVIESRAGDLLLCVKALRLRITNTVHVGDLRGACEVGRRALIELGISIPPLDDTDALMREYQREIQFFTESTRAGVEHVLTNLPVSHDAYHAMVQDIISDLAAPAILTVVPFFSLIMSAGATRCLRHGNNRYTPLLYAQVGCSLVLHGRHYRAAKVLADIGLSLSQSPALGDMNSYLRTQTWNMWNIRHWTSPLETTLPLADKSFDMCLQTHDLVFAAWVLVSPAFVTWVMARDLDEVRAHVRRAETFCDTNQVPFMKAVVAPFGAAAAALQVSSAASFNGSFAGGFDEAGFRSAWPGVSAPMSSLRVAKTQLLALAGEWRACLNERERELDGPFATYAPHLSHRFWRGVAAARLAADLRHTRSCCVPPDSDQPASADAHSNGAASADATEHARLLEEVDGAIVWYSPILKEGCASNVEDKVLWLRAERQWLAGDAKAADSLAEQAAALAGKNGFYINQGFMLESLGARRAAQQGSEPAHIRATLESAAAAYRLAKASVLEQRVCRALAELSDSRDSSRNDDGEFGLDALDAIAVLRGAQAISADIRQATLVPRLLRIMLEAGGGQRACIACVQGDSVRVEGAVGPECRFDSPPDQTRRLLPEPPRQLQLSERLARFVANTHEPVVLDASSGYGDFCDDPSLLLSQPQSVLCMPMRQSSEGLSDSEHRVLYLEHGELTGVFNGRRRRVLGWLAAQASISMENAALYERSRRELEERRRSENREVQRRRVLEQVATGTPLPAILEAIVRNVEAELESSGAVASVLLISPDGKHQQLGAGPSLPDWYNQAGRRVVASDVQTHADWVSFRHLASKAGVRACWSEPIRAVDGRLLGTFAIYHRDPCAPTEDDLRLLSYAAEVASLVIERKQADAELEQHRRRLEEQVAELRRLSERLTLATHGAGIGIWDWDVVRDELVWDDAMYGLYGIRREDFPGAYRAWTSLQHPDDKVRSKQVVRMALDGTREFAIEFRIIRPSDGAVRHLTGVARTYRDASGKATRMVGINYDITARKNAEESLRTLNEQLEAKVSERTAQLDAARVSAEAANRAKSAFLATMSHEIRTPMNAVLNMVGTVLESPLSEVQKEYLSVADSSARHLLSIINDILDFSKIESGKLEIEDIAFSMHGLLESITDLFRTRVAETGVELVLDIQPAVPDGVRGDPTCLRQILVNLVGNSFKFTPHGQIIVRVSVSCVADPLSSGGGPHGPRLQLLVSDSGVGIPLEQQSKLSQPFMQADSSTARRYGGTGLGLAISRRLAELMGGRITFTSVEHQGTEFTVDLPLHAAPEGNRDQQQLTLPATLKGRTALLIEDNDASRDAVRRLLENRGLACAAFPTLDSAVAWLQTPAAAKTDIAAALIDWHVNVSPGEPDSVAAVAALRRLRDNLPCFLLSASAGHGMQQMATSAAALFIPKPLTWSTTRTALHTALTPEGSVRKLKATPGPAGQPEAEAFQGVLALLAEDNKQNQLVAKAMLKRLGVSVEIAPNGRVAVDMATASPDRYHVILMDMQMPEMDGVEATRVIRQLGAAAIPRLATLPIIAMTANAMTSDMDACMDAGMNGFITKPIDRATLRVELAKALGPEFVAPGTPASGTLRHASPGGCKPGQKSLVFL